MKQKTPEELGKAYVKGVEDGEKLAIQKVLEIIDECSKGKGEWYKYYIKIKELKQKIRKKWKKKQLQN